MNTSEDIELHELDDIERRLSTEAPHEAEAEAGFLVVSASGFLVV